MFNTVHSQIQSMDVLISTTNINSESSNSTLVSMIYKGFAKKNPTFDFQRQGRSRIFFVRTYQPQTLSEHLPTPTYRQEQVRSLYMFCTIYNLELQPKRQNNHIKYFFSGVIKSKLNYNIFDSIWGKCLDKNLRQQESYSSHVKIRFLSDNLPSDTYWILSTSKMQSLNMRTYLRRFQPLGWMVKRHSNHFHFAGTCLQKPNHNFQPVGIGQTVIALVVFTDISRQI